MSKLVEINETQFDSEVMQADRPVLLYFWANWCGPCRLVSPSVEWAAETYSDRLKVVKMEIDPNPNLAKTYKVEGVPALRLIQGDEVLWSHEGAIAKPKLQEQLDSALAV